MLHTGLAILLGYRTIHKDKQKEYNLADAILVTSIKAKDEEKTEEIISQFSDIEYYESINPLFLDFEMVRSGTVDDSKNGKDTLNGDFRVMPYGSWGEFEAPHFVEMADEEYDNPIYVSISLNSSYFNAKLGDSIDLKIEDKNYTFQVAGIYEGLLSNVFGITYVSPEVFNELKTEQENSVKYETEKNIINTLYFMKVDKNENVMDVVSRLTKIFNENDILASAISVDAIISSLTYFQNLIAALLAAFAIVIAIISMIIIYFRISNSIEQNSSNIGALKALGYTSGQIRISMVIEFAVTTLISVIVGIASSYYVLPIIEKNMRGFSGVQWNVRFALMPTLITTVFIMGTVILVASLSTKIILRLDPIIALRFGMGSHSFKKNYAPIEKTAGSITWIMALKSVLGNAKQNVILFVAMLSIGLFTTFAAFLSYNCIYDSTNLDKMLSFVHSDVDFRFGTDENYVGEIGKLPEVEAIWWLDSTEMYVEGNKVTVFITDDWQDIPEVNIYKGRIPKYDNEVAIGGYMAKMLRVTVGDEIEVSYKREKRKYLITGLEQTTGINGLDISLTTDGAKHLKHEVSRGNISTIVKNHSLKKSQELINEVEGMYGEKLNDYSNIIEEIKSGNNSTTSLATVIVTVLVLISLVVIILTLKLMVDTLIVKKQKEIGIKKAIGFSSNQLRTELVLSMLPQIFAGACAGAILGCLCSNKTMSMLFSSLGVMKSNLVVFPWMGMVSVIFELVVSYVTIWLISDKIKNISAYSLITE
ncbi:MAG: FtsX-like permease family protein [Eubacterium sp.]|nr:FtsX-like permease family protein [Eubacterium sp.]